MYLRTSAIQAPVFLEVVPITKLSGHLKPSHYVPLEVVFLSCTKLAQPLDVVFCRCRPVVGPMLKAGSRQSKNTDKSMVGSVHCCVNCFI